MNLIKNNTEPSESLGKSLTNFILIILGVNLTFTLDYKKLEKTRDTQISSEIISK